MEVKIGHLLEYLDKKYPELVELQDLVDDGFARNIIDNACENAFIDQPRSRKYIISRDGMNLLNSIRIKKATEQLGEATDKLNHNINEFKRASKRSANWMIGLTIAIGILTIILIILTIAMLIQTEQSTQILEEVRDLAEAEVNESIEQTNLTRKSLIDCSKRQYMITPRNNIITPIFILIGFVALFSIILYYFSRKNKLTKK